MGAPAELTPKEIGGFRILRRLASGANSDVLLARAEGPHGFQRVVALKILLTHNKALPDFETRFAALASDYARLSHPAIVKLYDFFAADRQLVMVLEYVDGLPLHKLRAMLAIAGARVEDRAALFVGLRIFSALASAHAARDPATGEFAAVAHHDLNPSNILVPWDGHVKVADFGIAKVVGAHSDARAGFVKGTYGYISPEQARGEAISVRSDVYSAGLIVWELLARRKAVQRGTLSDADVLSAMAKPDFPALELLRPDIDPAVRDAVRRALEPNPDKRGVTAEEMVNILRQAIPGDEGRLALTQALGRIRPAGGGDPLASTQTRVAADPRTGRGANPAVEHIDPEQTAPFAAVTDEPGDLGKIAYYGRIKFPTDDEPTVIPGAPPAPWRAAASAAPTPVARPHASSPAASLEPASSPPSSVPRPSPLGGRSRVPRPTSDSPTVRAPPLDEQEEETQTNLMASQIPRLAPLPATSLAPRSPVSPLMVAARPAPVAPPAQPVPAEPPTTRNLGGDQVSSDPPPPLTPPAEAAAAAANLDAPPAPAQPEAPPVVASPVASPDSSVAPPSDTVRMADLPETLGLVHQPPPPVEPLSAGSPPSSAPASIAPPPVARSGWVGPLLAVLVVAAGVAGFFVWRASEPVPAPVARASAAPVPSAAPSAIPAAASATAASAPPPSSSAATSPEPPASAEVRAAAPSSTPSAAAIASSAPAESAPSAVPAVAAASSASAAPSASTAPAPGLAPDMGEIAPPSTAAGHRVFVDGRVAGEGTATIRVHCGSHTVRVGSAGTEHKLDVPCGGTISVGP